MRKPRRDWTPEEIRTLRRLHDAGRTDTDISITLGRPRSSVCGMRMRLGLPVVEASQERLLRPRPDDFVAMDAVMRVRDLAIHYGAGRAVIERWRKEIGAMQPREARPAVAMPADFADAAPRLTISECAARYGISTDRARKWCKAAGIRPLVKVSGYKPVPVTLSASDGSKAGVAATWLRSSGGGRIPNVYRATVLDLRQRKHLPNKGADHYFIAGRGFLHVDEMIALARSMGFRPKPAGAAPAMGAR